jgi:hypothetical protein
MTLKQTLKHGLEVWLVVDYQGYELGCYFSERQARTRKMELENHVRNAAN